MSRRTVARAWAGALLLLALFGCYFGDPGVHVVWARNFRGKVDIGCIERAVRSIEQHVYRSSYVSDGMGPRGFDKGVKVTQIVYSDRALLEEFSIDVAPLPNGTTRYWHQWGKLGTFVPDDEQRIVTPILVRVNRTIERRCGLPLAGAGPITGDG